MTQALTYVEVDVPYCTLTYGDAPCTAEVGVTGDRKCFNTLKTCQDRDNFDEETITLRYGVPTSYLPADIDCIPNIKTVEFTPATISLGADLGQRASISVEFSDHRDSDTGPAGDKYLSDRAYDPFGQGTYWGKFRARQPFLRGRALRLVTGYVGQALGDMETRHYIIDSFDGPTIDGVFKIIAKDVLKLADGDRAQAPRLSNGFLVSDITDAATTLTLSPSGIGNDEYPTSGYVAIGGKEICAFTRDPTAGNDSDCKLLLHFEGTDASTTFTDSSSSARTGTANGNAQIDTAQYYFQTSSGLFDGTGDFVTYPDSNDWTFAGNFTIEVHARFSSLAASRALWGQGSSATAQYRLIVSTAGAITFEVINTSTIITMASANGVIVIDTWYHIAVVRNGNDFNLYVNGVSVASTTDADAIPNYAGTFRVGADGASANGMAGWLDELRVSNVARWTTGFTVPDYAYDTSSDVIRIVRAQMNTEAQAAKAQDRVQVVLHYVGVDAADIISDLLQTYADVPATYIPLSNWLAETGSFLSVVYTAAIAEPTSINTLVSELIEQAALALWWDDLEQTIRLQVLRAVTTDAAVYSDDVIIAQSLGIAEQPDKRLSRVQTYFAQINPLRPLTDLDNFRSSVETVDADAETDYGSAAIKQILSRWIPELGRAIAQKLNQKQLSRFRDPPRNFSLALLRYSPSVVPSLGGGYQLQSWALQDDTGDMATVPVQVTRLKPSADKIIIDADEMLFLASGDDLDNRLIIVDVNTNNINLRTAHDAIYPEPVGGETVTCRIDAGVLVGSTSTSIPAFDVGSWPGGVTITLIVNGRIQGHGGQGGHGGDILTNGNITAGYPGGVALYLRYAIDVEYGAGSEVWGGGGGGGGGVGNSFGGGVGGGGGAGQLPGAVGVNGAAAGVTIAPSPGTTEAGGAGGTSTSGLSGAGGGPGLAGATAGSMAGGAAGAAIDGVSYITVTSGSADVRGPTIN